MKIKTIDINAKEWNGNSYFDCNIILNYGLKTEKSFYLPLQYGYGDHYIDVAFRLLREKKLIKADCNFPAYRYCDDNKIILRTQKQENCKKRELKEGAK